MSSPQATILPPIPDHSRYIEFTSRHGADVASVLKALMLLDLQDRILVGFGPGLIAGLGKTIAGLHGFKSLTGPGVEVPATQNDLLCWIGGTDCGEIASMSREIVKLVAPAFQPVRTTNGFKYKTGLDLTGYEDGTENPTGDDANAAAFVAGAGQGLDGSSFVAVQQWAHDMDVFASFSTGDTDDMIGRRQSDNVEFEGSPASAHVKRTAQESFTPEAFILRRSMPWSNADGEGLMFVAFGKSFDAYEAQMRRMAGMEDGIVDALFKFSRPISGANYWCPPVSDGKLDLSAIGL